MSAWTGLRSLAARLLGVPEPHSTDLSKLNVELSVTAKGIPKQPLANTQREAESFDVLPEYKFVLEAAASGCPAIFVTGRAGTGKSTLIRFLTSQLKNCAVLAPTALAAVNVRGSTIHSFFGLPPRHINPDEAFEPKGKIVPVIEVLDALIIDEISMVPPNLIDCISNTLRRVRRDKRPFGGVPIIFVGDLLQLPPVVSDREIAHYYTHRYLNPFFFSADIFRETEIISIELTKVFRQSSLEFVELLDSIRLNDNHRDAVAKINRHCYRDQMHDSSRSLFLVPTNAAAKAINNRSLESVHKPLRVFDAITHGRLDVERDRFQAPYRLEIKEGAQIIFVKNNKPYWVNGTLGRIVHISSEWLRIEILGKGNTVSVDRAVWEKVQYEYDPNEKKMLTTVVGSFQQFPITLGWAITIHKSQGMTLDSVRIDLGRGAFCPGQTYVALSRCRTLDGICLAQPISMSDVKADETLLDFYRRLQPLKDQNKLP